MMKSKQPFKITAQRPLSWSAISSFEYDREQWYRKYVLNIQDPPSYAMEFGKKFALAIENGAPLAPVTILPVVEQKLEVMFGDIPLIGFIDTYDHDRRIVGEFKTGKKEWTQKRVDEHGQIDMYLLMLFITHKIAPEEYSCFLEYVPTIENGDFSVSLKEPVTVTHFDTKRTMDDIIRFGMRIHNSIKAMEEFANTHA